MVIIKYCLLGVLFFSLFADKAFSEKACDTSNWQCHDAFNLSLGYIFTHVFFTDKQFSLPLNSQTIVDYSPAKDFPNNFDGIRAGFGSKLFDNKRFQ